MYLAVLLPGGSEEDGLALEPEPEVGEELRWYCVSRYSITKIRIGLARSAGLARGSIIVVGMLRHNGENIRSGPDTT